MMPPKIRSAVLAVLSIAIAVTAAQNASAQNLADPADQWLPSVDGASWTYQWDSTYSPVPTRERYTIAEREGFLFRVRWTTADLDNPDGAVNSEGQIDYRRTTAGLVVSDYRPTLLPPPQFPILCPSADQCANSLAGTHFMLIWGNRSPVLVEPLLVRARWSSLGGVDNDVQSASTYAGRTRVTVAAFPQGVPAARVEAQISQSGALGDPYGSGTRTVYWVRGVGPVKIEFRHDGGETSTAELVETNLVPRALPPDANYLPMNRGNTMRFRWRNSRHMRRPSIQDATVVDVTNNSARIEVKHVSGPIRVAGLYRFATRLNGITFTDGFTRTVSLAKFPPLGPRSAPTSDRRRFFTPFDLMVFGFNPVLPAFPSSGDTWRGTTRSSDYRDYGVTGTTEVLGFTRVQTRFGRVRALTVRSRLTQRGFPFGSGTRTSYFQAGRGLVKLIFRHRDGSVSTVDRLR